jgi:diacylglycerol O-acyltransferase / wax synthase
MRQQLIHTITTNVPGPDFPLCVLGRRLTAIYPDVPFVADIRVSTGVISYLDDLYFGITGDFDAMPDLDMLSDGITRGLDELAKAAVRA